jgi:hypothetical protein
MSSINQRAVSMPVPVAMLVMVPFRAIMPFQRMMPVQRMNPVMLKNVFEVQNEESEVQEIPASRLEQHEKQTESWLPPSRTTQHQKQRKRKNECYANHLQAKKKNKKTEDREIPPSRLKQKEKRVAHAKKYDREVRGPSRKKKRAEKKAANIKATIETRDDAPDFRTDPSDAEKKEDETPLPNLENNPLGEETESVDLDNQTKTMQQATFIGTKRRPTITPKELSDRKMKELEELHEVSTRVGNNPHCWQRVDQSTDAAVDVLGERTDFKDLFLDGNYGVGPKGKCQKNRVETTRQYRPDTFLPKVEPHTHSICGRVTEYATCDKCHWFCGKCGAGIHQSEKTCTMCNYNPIRKVRGRSRTDMAACMANDVFADADEGDEAYNPTDEVKVQAQKTMLEFGKRETKHRATADLNQRTLESWTAQQRCLKEGEVDQPSLLCFIPKNANTISGMCLRTRLDIGDSKMLGSLIEEVLVIEKPTRQITFQLRMDLKLHLGTTSRMIETIRQKLGLGKNIKHTVLKSGVDHAYQNKHPMRPCVVNTDKVKCLDGATPLLEKMECLVLEIVKAHLEEFLVEKKAKGEARVEKRAKHCQAIGFTDTQAASWERKSEHAHAIMGMIPHSLSTQCLTKVGALVDFMCHEFVGTALAGTDCAHFFSVDRNSTLYSLCIKRAQAMLGIKGESMGHNLAENVQFNFGRPDRLSGHYDSKDDTRTNRNGHVTACLAAPVEKFSVSQRALLEKNGLVQDSKVWVTVICFTRKAVGDQAAINDGKKELNKEIERLMFDLLTSDQEDKLDTELLLDDKYVPVLQKLNGIADEMEHGVRFAKRPEARRKEFFYASSVHASLRLLSTHHTVLPSSYNTLVSLLMVIGHQNGQHLQHGLLSKWISGRFEDGTFSDGWEKHKDLYLMFCHELAWRHAEEGTDAPKNKWISGSLVARFQSSQDVLYRPDKHGSTIDIYKRRRAAICQAIEKSALLLSKQRRHNYNREVALEVQSEFENVEGLGPLLAQQFVQFAARLGLLPAYLCEFGVVDGKKGSTSGPSKFMRGNCEECGGESSGLCECAADVVVKRFYDMVDTLRDDHKLHITDMIAENCACLLSRMTNVKGDKRKKDCLFWDGCALESTQNFIIYNNHRNGNHIPWQEASTCGFFFCCHRVHRKMG